MNTTLGTVIIYARDMKKTAQFYSEHFGFQTTGEVAEGLVELHAPNGGAGILIHQAAKSVKLGKVGVKLSFHVQDVQEFANEAHKHGLKFEVIPYANADHSPTPKDTTKQHRRTIGGT